MRIICIYVSPCALGRTAGETLREAQSAVELAASCREKADGAVAGLRQDVEACCQQATPPQKSALHDGLEHDCRMGFLRRIGRHAGKERPPANLTNTLSLLTTYPVKRVFLQL